MSYVNLIESTKGDITKKKNPTDLKTAEPGEGNANSTAFRPQSSICIGVNVTVCSFRGLNK